MKFKELKAFTLAETLITLTVIGIVAAISIPSFTQNFEKQKFRTAAKKAYATISAAVNQMKSDEGGTLSQYDHVGDTFKPAFIKYFKVIKDCNWASCIPESAASTDYSTLNGNMADTFTGGEGQFVTTDGMFINIQNPSSTAITIIVDVNGYVKGPNKYGVDTFSFDMLNDNLLPSGITGTTYNICNTSSTNAANGLGCTVKVIKDENY